MKQTSKLIQAGTLFLFTCVLAVGCSNDRHQAKQGLIEEMAQQQAARRKSMELYLQAMSEYDVKNFQKAHNLLRQSVDVNSRNASAWVALGILEYEKDNLFEAAHAVSQALRLEPGRFEAHYNMGLIYETAGKYSQAITSYEKALQIAPDEPAVMENLIRCYMKTAQRREETLRLIDRALLLEPRPQWREWLEIQKFRLLQRS
jgi:tetratricopeptide (TPR) repeat protein